MTWRGPSGVFADEVRPRLLAPSAELILDALPPLSPNTRFLEVGAGGAVLSRPLMERIAGLGRLVAIDDDVALAAALPAQPRRAARAVAATRALPFKGASFDVVIGNLAVDVDIAAMLGELRRVARPGAHIVFSAILSGSFEQLFNVVADLADGRRLHDVAEAVAAARAALIELDDLRAGLDAAGLTVGQVGVEERLLGLANGAMLRADALMTSVVLKDILATAPTGFIDAIAQGVDAWYKDGLAIVVRTGVVTARSTSR